NAVNCVDSPWQREGYEHTSGASSIIRYWGNDYFDHTTATLANPVGSKYTKAQRGYTDTGSLCIRVLDSKDQPVEGAMIILRRCGAVAVTTDLGYTDLKGECYFDLGEARYTITVFTPYGSAGTKHFFMEEEKSFICEYRLRSKKEDRLDHKSTVPVAKVKHAHRYYSINLAVKEMTGLLNFPSSFFSSARWAKESELKRINFRGSITQPYPIKQGRVDCFVLDENNFQRYQKGESFESLSLVSNPENFNYSLGHDDLYFVFSNKHSSYATEKMTLEYTATAAPRAPRIEIPDLPTGRIVITEDFTITGTATDNLGVKTFEVSVDNGQTFHDVSSYLDQNTGEWSFGLRKFTRGLMRSGNYNLVFKATDAHGLKSSVLPIALTVKPLRVFKNQAIYQDDPETPLPTSSWMLGPFFLSPEKERFIDIRVTCPDRGVDLDLFLFRDKNEDGKINDMDEQHAKSTSPISDERISINNIVTGTYWIYCQGWQVEKEKTECNVSLSFDAEPRMIVSKGPRDVTGKAQPDITAKLVSLSDFDDTRTVLKIDGQRIYSGWSFTRTSTTGIDFKYPLPKTLDD
ncbi:MAG: hypothetical protein KAI63_07320, partial [Planctomycetes bacterium]|nr:hypothetical protein [Planctomycetota bacterium]